MRFSRVILTICSLLLAFGGVAHGRAFPGALAAIAKADNLAAFYRNDFKVLWLADSTTLFTVAALFAMVAIRPSSASRALVFVIALIPAATAIMIYVFVGGFYAAHLLMSIAIAASVAALKLPRITAAA